jgi:hypothetical protein
VRALPEGECADLLVNRGELLDQESSAAAFPFRAGRLRIKN